MSYPLSLSPFLAPTASGNAFERRTLHPWMDRRPMPLADPEAHYAAQLAQAAGPRLVYVHIPFCINHCLFCGFYRNKAEHGAMSAYVDHLIAEIEQDGARIGATDHPVEAIFLGGGTPTALSARDLHRILTALRRTLPLTDDCEVTVEGRVAGFDTEKVDACLDAGANRFSIGIQSFDTALRRRMGRKASEAEAVAFLADLVARDQAAVVCDLIYGLPGQTDETWRRDVALCNEIGLDGVDLYCLTMQPDSPLARSIDKGALPPAADDMTAQRRYRQGEEILEHSGWRRLSQAHWSRTDKERNRYNRATKQGRDCLAFGAGAGGMLQGYRFMNGGDVAGYQDSLDAGRKPVMAALSPARHHVARGLIMDALETGTLDLARLATAVEAGFAAAIAPLLDHWNKTGLIRRQDDMVTLTTTGRYWHNNLASVLFQAISAYVDGPETAPTSHAIPGMPPVGRHPSPRTSGLPHAASHHP